MRAFDRAPRLTLHSSGHRNSGEASHEGGTSPTTARSGHDTTTTGGTASGLRGEGSHLAGEGTTTSTGAAEPEGYVTSLICVMPSNSSAVNRNGNNAFLASLHSHIHADTTQSTTSSRGSMTRLERLELPQLPQATQPTCPTLQTYHMAVRIAQMLR
jgi:hypothetical protein